MNALRGRTLCMAALLLAWLSACGTQQAAAPLVERVQPGHLVIAVYGQGELKATRATPLLVPGEQWANRQLAWALADGSHVNKGDLIARFSAEQSKRDLSEALIDLERNALARASKQSDLYTTQGQLGVDMADVGAQLAIAHRYANAGFEALSRNQVLDAVQNEQFLTVKQSVLDWRTQQSDSRGTAELAVLDAKHATFELTAKQKRDDLEALEIRAPHDGVLVMERNWAGEKPDVGSSLFAGLAFGSLPDTSALEVQISVPQVQAQGIGVGDTVQLHPLGMPDQSVDSRLGWVAATAQPRSRESPVKYLAMKAPVPAKAASQYGWVPGQRFAARVVLLDAPNAISVPNVAIDSSSKGASVQVLEGGRVVRREITLGVRGANRAQVLKGLRAGDQVVLDAGTGKDGA